MLSRISLRMGRVFIVGFGLVFSSCLLPPDRLDEQTFSFPPMIALTDVRPREPLLRIRLTPPCPNSLIEVNNLMDLDSSELLVRWVLNNNLPSTRLLFEDRLTTASPGTVLNPRWRLDINEDLDPDGSGNGPAIGDTPVLSFFVTDGSAWASDPADAGVQNPGGEDLGLVREPGANTVEVRWTFIITEAGGCL